MSIERNAFVVGIVGLAGAVAGLLIEPRIALTAWTAAAVGWAEVPLGCLALLMMVQLVGGSWRPLLQAPFAAGATLLPLTALTFVPVLIGAGWVYPWADPHVAAALPAFKSVWLSPAFWIVRTVIYFGVFVGLQQGMLRAPPEVRNGIAAGGLILFALLASLAGVDWLESIHPEFHSSEYGLIFMAGTWLGGIALALLIALPARDDAPLAAAGVFVTALLFWGYLHAMQYIVIWSGDIPREVHWYLRRTETGWVFVTWGLVALQFVAPFLALLSPSVRSSSAGMLAIAGVTLAMRLVEAAWMLLPPTGLPALPTALLLVASWAAIGGFGAVLLLRAVRRGERFVERSAADG
ncbi:hypothetical protein SCH01S_15_00910 [Sphingomonas changbaiensis NBRC 104936]|uniref:Uncharacterized protein n=1 Tax=Sphingomonas changbaiensis NBRC 104936 TaxID=1219043 RepID=A0A0E9MM34_9SPHN|nr:hypothetical protein [Sphingomonas changbaiensis]GAO38466.1 hypothetical protein SCH01S_15_00910 [Sphingomonas changbaiensis NBRC 104936]